jgi:hypothetical protein
LVIVIHKRRGLNLLTTSIGRKLTMIFKKSDSYAQTYNYKKQKEREENVQCDAFCENQSSVTELVDIQKKSKIE